jgi:hypothetical protein
VVGAERQVEQRLLTEVAAAEVVRRVRRGALAAAKSGHRDWGQRLVQVTYPAVPPLPVMRRASAVVRQGRLQVRAAAHGIQPIVAVARRPVLLPRQESADRSARAAAEVAAKIQIRGAVAAGRIAAVVAAARNVDRRT